MSSAFPADVTAITVSFNSVSVLPGCLAALARNGINKIIIVDNDSTDNIDALAAQQGGRVQLITNTVNEGFGRGMNRGVATAPTPWCLLINPDAQLDDGALSALLDAARAYPQAALFGPAIFEKGETTPIFSARAMLSYFLPNKSGRCAIPTAPASTPFISGACLLVRRDAFLQLGGFDPNIFLYYEDDDLCRRFSEARLGPVYVPGAHVRHAGSQSTETRTAQESLRLTATVKWHQTWSRLYVAKKYGLKPARTGKILVLLLRHAMSWLKSLFGGKARHARAAAAFGATLAFLRGRTALERQGLSS